MITRITNLQTLFVALVEEVGALLPKTDVPGGHHGDILLSGTLFGRVLHDALVDTVPVIETNVLVDDRGMYVRISTKVGVFYISEALEVRTESDAVIALDPDMYIWTGGLSSD